MPFLVLLFLFPFRVDIAMLIVPRAEMSAQSAAADLKSTDVAVRRKAANQLARMTTLPPDILPVLRASIKDPDDVVGYQVALALANAGAQALRELDMAFKDPSPESRKRISGAFSEARQAGPEIWPLLIRSFQDADRDVQVNAARAFQKIGEAALPLLQRTLQDADPRMRRGACEALQYIGAVARPLSPDLLRVLQDPEPAVGYQSAFALAAVDPVREQPVPVLLQALGSSDWLTRLFAAQSLGMLGQHASSAIPSLLDRLTTDSDIAVKRDAAQALAKIRVLDSSQVEKMARALQDKEPLTRNDVALSLGELGPDARAAIPFLLEALHDDTSYVRSSAAMALGHYGEAALPGLVQALNSKDIYVRQSAVEAMRQMKPLTPAAVPILTGLLEDKNADVSDGAAGVLLQAGIGGEWLAKYNALQEARLNRTKHEEEEVARLYSKEEIIRTIPADDDYKYPLQLESMVPVPGNSMVQLLVTLHRGKDRPDRLAIWKQVGENYQRLKLMLAPAEPGIASFEGVNIFHYQGYLFIQVALLYSGTGHFVDESIFAVQPDNTLAAVRYQPDAKGGTVDLKPGEGVRKGVSTHFSDDNLAFEYYIWNEGDGNCCPTAGKVTGTYKISRETKFDAGKRVFLDEWTMTVDKAVREPIGK